MFTKPTTDFKDLAKMSHEDLFATFQSTESGLSSQIAQQRLHDLGYNQISEVKKDPWYKVMIHHFTSMMAILLWISGVLSYFAGMPQLTVAVWMVNIINGLFSFFQEFKASKATEALKKLIPANSKVLRDGQTISVNASELVIGDIIQIDEGDKISADGRVLSCSDLSVNQSTLTGESNPVLKTAESFDNQHLNQSDIPNLVFAGTTVSNGSAMVLVTATGMDTVFGKIAGLTQSVEEKQSPLQKELDHLTKQISLIAVGFGILFFILAVFYVKDPIAQSFIFALGMIVAFIPEGLLPTVTLALSMAVLRMSKENALVKKLSAVETLGCTTVICSDKTGTLTQNEMTVCNLVTLGHEYEVSGIGYENNGDILEDGNVVSVNDSMVLLKLLRGGALCNNAKLVPAVDSNSRVTVLGDPTEACLLVSYQKSKQDLSKLWIDYPRLRECPFDSNRKRMTTLHQTDQLFSITKGAPKEVLDLCDWIMTDEGIREITSDDRANLMAMNDKFARNGLRVLSVAQRVYPSDQRLDSMSDYTAEYCEQHMTFIGLQVMSDPARPEVAQAVKECRDASIRIIMITGDYGLTAESIAKRIGIVQSEHPRVITGQELATLSLEELKTALKDEVIFARVASEQKYQIVSALQEMGEIVAVTGDGVNDAPALKKADIGVAMGITGTDVAKEAADMILMDDNFASIVKAIEEGRAVYQNIRKFLVYILNSNMPEAAPSTAFLLSKGAIPLPLTVMQILVIDLGTDLVPALGLGCEVPEKGIMNQPPRNQKEPILNKSVILKGFFWYGMIESVIALAAYFFVNMTNGWPNTPLASSGFLYQKATTMTLAAIIFAQIGMVMNCRSNTESIFKVGLFKNTIINKGLLVELLVIIVLCYVPLFQNIFGTVPLDILDWVFLMCIPLPVILIEEVRKYFLRKKVNA